MGVPQIVFVLSTNYSGSHLLAQLLSAHSRCAGVGELHNYRKFRRRGSRSGNVVDDYGEHPAFAGLDDLSLGAWHPTIFERLRAARPELTHLIDNSKRPEWARRFPRDNAYLIHLLRDPRALVSRWLRTFESEAARRSQRRRVLLRRPAAWFACRDDIGTFVEKWLISNRAISRFTGGRARSEVLTYRDLACDPARNLERLMSALNLAYEPAQLDYGNAPGQLGTRKRDYHAATGRSEIQLDARWREHLNANEQQRICRHPGLARYLEQLGLTMVEDGLTAGS